MHIRTKLILAFFYLVGLVVLTAASAGFGFNQVYSSFVDVYARNEIWIAETRKALSDAPDAELRPILDGRLSEYERGLRTFRAKEREIVLTNGVQLGFLVTIGLLTLTFISVALQRDILSRLFKLKTFCEALLRGNRHLRISMTGNDELTLLGRLLNVALDRQDELQAELKGKLAQQKEMVLGLMRACGPELMLMDATGEILVSMLPTDAEAWIREQHAEIKKWLGAQSLENMNTPLSYQRPGLSVELRPVGAHDGAVVGYIVSWRA